MLPPGVVIVKEMPLLVTPPTVTTTFPVDAPDGTGTTMLVADQLVGVAGVPLNVTVLEPLVDPKFAPAMVTTVPAAPVVGVTLVIDGVATTLPEPVLADPVVLAAVVTIASAEYAPTRPAVLYARTAK